MQTVGGGGKKKKKKKSKLSCLNFVYFHVHWIDCTNDLIISNMIPGKCKYFNFLEQISNEQKITIFAFY